MTPKIVYWTSTALVALALLGSLSYLTGSEQVVSGFAKAGYPQHLRIVLGFAKPAAAIVLLAPGLPLLKEWAYAGVTFALVMATISAYSTGDSVQAWGLPGLRAVGCQGLMDPLSTFRERFGGESVHGHLVALDTPVGPPSPHYRPPTPSTTR